MPVSSLRIFMLKGTEKVQFQPFNPRNAFICLPFQFCLRQQNVNKTLKFGYFLMFEKAIKISMSSLLG